MRHIFFCLVTSCFFGRCIAFKLSEIFPKRAHAQEMCMVNTSASSDKEISDKYSRFGMTLPARDFMNRALFHAKKKKYVPAYYLFLMAFHVAKNNSVEKQKSLQNIGLSLMRHGRKLCKSESTQDNVHSGKKMIAFAIEKFRELSQLFPDQKAWVTRKMHICKSWIIHACNFTRGEYHIGRSTENMDEASYNKVQAVSKLKKIRRLQYNTSMEPLHTFLSLQREPIILENSPVLNWTLFQKMSWSYIRKNFPRYITLNLNKANFDLYEGGGSRNKKTVYLDEALRLFENLENVNSTETSGTKEKYFPYWMKNINILRGHNFKDEFVNDALETPYHQVSLCGDKVGDSVQCPTEANLWIGARNVHAVGHYDSQHNSYVQIQGLKEFILAPPSAAKYLYVYPRSSIRHHRQLKLVDLENVNRSLFPEFRDDMLYKAILKPGDLLSMPPYWFHQVRSLTSSIALNVWSLSSVAAVLQEAANGAVGEIFRKNIAVTTPSDDKLWKLAVHLEFCKLYLLRLFHGDTSGASKFINEVVLARYRGGIGPKMEEVKCKGEHTETGLCPPLIFSESILPLARQLILDEVDHRLNSLHSSQVQKWNAFDILVSNTLEAFVVEGIQLHGGDGDNATVVSMKVFKCCLHQMLHDTS